MSINEYSTGLPDPSVLERLANEYFKQTTSGFSSSEPSAVSNEQFTSLPSAPYNIAPVNPSSVTGLAGAVPNLPGVLSTPDLESLPLTLTPTEPRGYMPPTTVPAVPGIGISAVPSTTTFSFLNDIRAPISVPTIPAALAIPAAKLPTDGGFGNVESSLPGAAVPVLPRNVLEVSAPLISGGPTHAPDFSQSLNYGFVRDIRPISSFNDVPKIEPFGYVPDAGSLVSTSSGPYDVNAVRRDFPILEERINGRQLVWLDNAATTQKPLAVINRLSQYYLHENSNVHRAAHALAARSTDAYEGARDKVAEFLKASSSKEIIFVRGATEGINLIAQTWGKKNIQKDDEIVITWLEHHANIVPWQMLCSDKGARLKVAPVDNDGQVILEEYEKLLGPKTKLVSITQVSNALGTITPVQAMVATAHRYGARAVIDGAQAVSHIPIDVQAYDCDFYVFSGHKVFAPFGIGVVYGKPEVLEHMPPWQGGGNMIVDVTFEKTVYHGPPGRFEAGTGSIAPAVGLGAAIDYLNTIGMHNIARYEHDLLLYAIDALSSIPGLHLIGTAKEKASVLSFVLDGFRTEDVGTALNQEGIAVRSGHHCAQPILRRFGLESTVRPSLALYNTCEEVDKLVSAIWNLKQGRTAGPV